ncbi:MAG TPA: CHASE3 domain-containing protein [Ramlibacter sp.]|nr:CHASE3 domain-containing protein [Ramlibacter sp.]
MPLIVSFALALAAVIAIGAGAQWNARALSDARAWVAHSLQTQASIENVLSLLKDVESGQRGYLLTGRDEDLESHRVAGRELNQRLDDLGRLTVNDPEQQARLHRLKALAAERLRLSDEAVRLRQAGDLPRAQELVASGRGRRAMDEARTEATGMNQEEELLLRQRLADAEAISRRSLAMAGVTTVLILGLLCVVFFMARRGTEQLRESESRYRTLTEALPHMVWTADARFVPTYFSQHWKTFTDWDFEHPAQHDWLSLVHPDDRPNVEAVMKQMLATQQPVESQLRLLRRDGAYRWVLVRTTPRRGESGKVVQWICTLTDVHDQWQANEALRQSQALTEAVIEGSTSLVFAKDLEGRYFLSNRAWRELVGSLSDVAMGMDDEALFGAETARQLRSADQRAIDEGQAIVTEESAQIRGQRHTFLSSKFPLLDAGGRAYAVCGIATDVTDLKEAQQEVLRLNADLEARVVERTRQLLEANEELEAFSYTVSHDLRAPLRGIQGFAQAVCEDCAEALDPQGKVYLDRIIAGARRMESLIQDLLDYGRLSRQELRLQPTSLGITVSDAIKALAHDVDDHQARLEVEQPMPVVMAHPVVLLQILGNLLGNALKFAKPGQTPHIRVRAETRGERVRVWVEDKGIGIRPEHQGRIFQVFERLHAQESYPGTGVGLAIVRKGSERMGGECGVESTPGEGSRFWFELAAAKGQGDE